jgi:hypothetical protein
MSIHKCDSENILTKQAGGRASRKIICIKIRKIAAKVATNESHKAK